MSSSSAIDSIYHVKDEFRRFRYGVRQNAAGDSVAPLRAPLPKPIALAADSVLRIAEAARDALAQPGAATSPCPASIRDYVTLAQNSPGFSRGFTGATYRMFEALAVRFGAKEVLISELALEQARRSFLDTRSAGSNDTGVGSQAMVRDCAALAVALASTRPIKQFIPDYANERRPAHFVLSPNLFVGCAVGLCGYIAASEEQAHTRDPNSAILTAEAAIETHFARLSKAMLAPDQVEALAREFAVIVSFLGAD